MRAWMWLVALAACGAPADEPADLLDGARSGSRLRLEYFDFGTTRTVYGLFDAERGERCYLETWADGGTYCTPSDRGPIAYTDARCEDAVGIVHREAGCTRPPPAYFSAYATTCGAGHAHLYPRGDQLPEGAYYLRDATGACSGPLTSDADLYVLGPEVPVTDLVPTTLGDARLSGRLGVRVHTSADGLQLPAFGELYDAMLDTTCRPLNQTCETTSGRCVPGATYAGYFTEGCTTRLASAPASCEAPGFATLQSTCPTAPAQFFHVGDPLTPTSLYLDTGTSCVMVSALPDEHYFTVGDEVSVATLARERVGSGGRLEPVYFTTSEGLRARDFELHDALLQADCFPSERPDGTTVCLPASMQTGAYFTDEQCTTPIRLGYVSRLESSCAPPPLPAFAIEYLVQPACGLDYAVYEVGALYTAGIYQRTGTACSQILPTDTVFYRLAAQVPTNALASGTLVVD